MLDKFQRNTIKILSCFVTVITNKLDGIMLTNIIRAIDKQFVPRGKFTVVPDRAMLCQFLCYFSSFTQSCTS